MAKMKSLRRDEPNSNVLEMPNETTGALVIGSPEQDAIWSAVANDQSVLVEAVAGSGKTFTTAEAIRRIKRAAPNARTLYLAFGKDIAAEMRTKCPQTESLTYHQFGLRTLLSYDPTIKVNEKRMWPLIEGMRVWSPKEYKAKGAVKRLCSLAKQSGFVHSSQLAKTIDNHAIDCGRLENEVVHWSESALKIAGRLYREIDFDDMVWLPQHLKLDPPEYDLVCIDEAQDTNLVQQYLGLGDGKTQRLIVGDPRQAIYAWRGADSGAMARLGAAIACTRENSTNLPLSYTRRCPRVAVELARKLGVDIHPLEDAPDGSEVVLAGFNAYLKQALPGDMVLSRVNAPMIESAYKLIEAGIPAFIRGKDISDGIFELIDKSGEHGSVADVLKRAESHTRLEAERFLAMPDKRGEKRAALAMDRLSCLFAAAKGCTTIAQLHAKVDSLFDVSSGGVQFATVYKAKGLEANRVFLLTPDLHPHPYSTKGWELEQEKNLLYVAVTRTMYSAGNDGTIGFIGGKPGWLKN